MTHRAEGIPAARVLLFQEVGRRLDTKGFIASNDGNLTTREEDGSFLVTATGSRKGHLRANEVLRIDAAGRVLEGGGAPSTETGMHLAVYAARPDVRAVVHAHPPAATGFAAARLPLEAPVLPEVIATLGVIPLAPYATPGTGEVVEALRPFLSGHDALLLANHGVVAFGPDLEEAYFRLERVEQAARILLVARLLGGWARLDLADVLRLRAFGPVPGDSAHDASGAGPSGWGGPAEGPADPQER